MPPAKPSGPLSSDHGQSFSAGNAHKGCMRTVCSKNRWTGRSENISWQAEGTAPDTSVTVSYFDHLPGANPADFRQTVCRNNPIRRIGSVPFLQAGRTVFRSSRQFHAKGRTNMRSHKKRSLLGMQRPFMFDFLSGYRDSNPGPPTPEAGALTGLRYTPIVVGDHETLARHAANKRAFCRGTRIRTWDPLLPKQVR